MEQGICCCTLQNHCKANTKHIYCNISLVKKKKRRKKVSQSMSIDSEQHRPCPQVFLSCSLGPCQVIRASEVSEFPDSRVRETRLQLQSKEETNYSNQHLSVYLLFFLQTNNRELDAGCELYV